MGFIALLLFVYICVHQDFIKCEKHELMDVLVELGDSLTLNCTYNCSSGFVRGYWCKEDNCVKGNHGKKQEEQEMCTVFFQLRNVSSKDLMKYNCYSEIGDDTSLMPKKERVVELKLRGPACCESRTSTQKTATTNPKPTDFSAKGKPGMNDGMKVLAAVTITVALVLAALAVYVCLTRSRQGCNGKDHQSPGNLPKPPKASSTTLPTRKGPTPKQNERVTVRIPTPETEGDPEVPYADIVISVRGASTPDLSQALYLNSADRNEWWTAKPGPHLQAARSADMLHVPQPREVSRKMSTNSEYAVIMYA